ncbi:YpbB family protein [Alkalicoccobacillus murimartini]|uniref:Uncharacterized protein YpbB n=1 Tax=Alkalicoccobacillus murimartini TaxID=171685 RepID=A0ABT9YEF4_9BACI|nr:helix-turn-helix domain-containing protein [Alkalicoccobacillus murimartini]MDQ0205875.1 uncharacterized protein YpbB [Alkalicoccobacillus murimartini]
MKKELLLSVLHAYKGERTIYGAFHILQGKKTAQSIQDGHFFSVLPFYNLLPDLTRQEVDDLTHTLESNGLIRRTEEDKAILTKQGERSVHRFTEDHDFISDLNGWKYLRQTSIFWLRLTLLIQTATHIKANQPRFIPITNHRDSQQWVKNHLQRYQGGVDALLDDIYKDISSYLQTCRSEQAQAFVMQLSSPAQVGLTLHQISQTLNLDSIKTNILHKATLHRLFNACEDGAFPSLYACMGGKENQTFSTETALKTAQLMKQGLKMDQIIQARGLKQSTIEDHIVEIALYDTSFSIEPYVSDQEIAAIVKASMELQTLKLKELRSVLGDDYTYFKIRMALTRKDPSYGAS